MRKIGIAMIIALIAILLVSGCTTNTSTTVQPQNPTTVVVVTNEVTPVETVVQPQNPTTIIVVGNEAAEAQTSQTVNPTDIPLSTIPTNGKTDVVVKSL